MSEDEELGIEGNCRREYLFAVEFIIWNIEGDLCDRFSDSFRKWFHKQLVLIIKHNKIIIYIICNEEMVSEENRVKQGA